MDENTPFVDLTQDTSSDDELRQSLTKDKPISKRSSLPSESVSDYLGMLKFNYEEINFDPLTTPLINTAHSVSYALSSSTVDPFSNLIKCLQQSSSEYFFQLTQYLAFNRNPVEFIELLKKLISNTQLSYPRHLAIKSIIALSINNQEFCEAILKNIEYFIKISTDENEEFLDDILQLYQTICDFANHEQAELILENINQRALMHHKNDENAGADPIRIKVYPVLALLARYGDLFKKQMVDEIIAKSNYPGEGYLSRDIMWPALICIHKFLSQPETEAYSTLKSAIKILYGKMALNVITCEKDKNDELRVFVLKIFLELLDEFYDDCSRENATKPFMFQIKSALISMKNFSTGPVQRMATILLKKIKVETEK